MCEWISTKDRLPEFDVNVLCFSNCFKGKTPVVLHRQQEDRYVYPYSWVDDTWNHDFDPDEVSHWMPLPEPPK